MNSNKILLLLVAMLCTATSYAQLSSQAYTQATTTAVPFLRIGPDARDGGMGDGGIGVSPDVYGGYWCQAKMPYVLDNTDKLSPFGVGVTYTPWLRALVNDIYLADLSAYYRINKDQVLTTSLRYFSLGTINFTDASGNSLGDFSPHEMSYDIGYSRLLAQHFSVGVALRYIYSNLAKGYASSPGVPIKAGNSAAADLSFMYSSKATTGEKDEDAKLKSGDTRISYNVGMNISNVGAKITYTSNAQNKDYLPATFAIGGAPTFWFDKYNKLTAHLDLSKLLVPNDTAVSNGVLVSKTYGVPESIVKSFSEPSGAGNQFKEIMVSVGAEYWYQNEFAIRAGYFNESQYTGDRKYLTAGIGLKLNLFAIDFSYLIPTNSQKNPLDNTLRFSLLFNFSALKGDKDAAPAVTE